MSLMLVLKSFLQAATATRSTQLEFFEDDEDYNAALDSLDSEFYKYEDNLAELLHDFVRNDEDADIEA
tara:strand:- start:8767 stop:8970 length:204 start_codon:yes stop_codon:yes gene_type:complete